VEDDSQASGLEQVAEALLRERVLDLHRLARAPARPVAKAARRALYLLRLRGLEVGEGPIEQSSGAAPGKSAERPPAALEREPCLMTPIDGFGDRALWIPTKRKIGFSVTQILLSDVSGVLSVEETEMSRRQLRQFYARLREREDAAPATAPIEVPRARAQALLAEAVALAPQAQGAAAAKRILSEGGEGDEALPQAAAATVLPGEAAALAGGPELFSEPELRSYVPSEEALRALGARLDEIAVSALLVDERQRAEQRRHAVDRLVETTFTLEARGRYARRLFELADHFAATGRAPQSDRAAATARHLAGPEPILTNPFARAFFARLVREPESSESPKPSEPSSRIIAPR
jgi:hypothetical protein